MSVAVLLEELRRRDIELRIDGEQLRCSAPAGALGPELREQLRQHKQDILDFLNAAQTLSTQQPAIVPLQPNGDRPAVFGVAGHNGDVFCYRALVEHLGKDQPFFGLQPPGFDGRGQPLNSVDELVAYFAEQIRAFQPGQPYVIVGYCAGGTIAFELARQLCQQGATIRFVALFGSPSPTWYRFLPQLRRTAGEQATRLGNHLQALTSLSWTELRQYIADKWRRRQARGNAERSKAADPVIARRVGVENATLTAVRRYQPGHFAGRLYLILPNRQWGHASDPWMGWPAELATHTEEYCGPDDCKGHEMLLAPNVSPFAEFLRTCLDRL